MLERQYDWVCIGENLYSLVFSLGAISGGRKTAILKDKRFDGSGPGSMVVDHLFVELLKLWGQDQLVAPLEEIEHELTGQKITFVVNGIQLRLGGLPAENFLELFRKFSFLPRSKVQVLTQELLKDPATYEKFNREILDFVTRFSRHLYHYRSMQSISIQELIGLMPAFLKNWIEELWIWTTDKEVQLSQNWWPWKSFLFMISGQFRSRATLNMSFGEFAYLLIQALMPLYGFKSDGLLLALRQEFLEQGGQVRQTDVIDWHFENNRLWALELSCYEGVVYPKDVFIFSDRVPTTCPLVLADRQESLRTVGLKLPHSGSVASKMIMGISSNELAHEAPMWKVTFGQDEVTIAVFVKERPGQLSAMYGDIFNRALSKLMPTLLPHTPVPTMEDLRKNLSFLPEVWERPSHWDDWSKVEREFPRFAPAQFRLFDALESQQRPVYGVWYMGPHLGRFLGPVGTPLEMKQFLFKKNTSGSVNPAKNPNPRNENQASL